MDSPFRPQITFHPNQIKYGEKFSVSAAVPSGTDGSSTLLVLMNPGFHTHAVGMGMRMVTMEFSAVGNNFEVTAPRDASVMQPGVYLLFLVTGGIPSGGVWVQLWS